MQNAKEKTGAIAYNFSVNVKPGACSTFLKCFSMLAFYFPGTIRIENHATENVSVHSIDII